jgi:hypothetical protein
MDMVERVARALHRAFYERGRRLYPEGAWAALDQFEREMWLFSARAAIGAMRPLLERAKADLEVSAEFLGDAGYFSRAKDAMDTANRIDAALQDKTGG